jgi:RES domain
VEELPLPPVGFSVDAILQTCPAGTRFVRIYCRSGKYPCAWDGFRQFGPTKSRFDHHTEPPRKQTRAILYAATGPQALSTALAEVFQETRLIDRKRNDPWVAIFDVEKPLELLDTTGHWPVRAGGNMSINSGRRDRARAWSRAIYSAYAAVEGIWYPSSVTNQSCVALYDRALHAMPLRPIYNEALDSPKLLRGLLDCATTINYMVA